MNDASRDESDGFSAVEDPRRHAGDAPPPRAPGDPDPVAALQALAMEGVSASTWASEETHRGSVVRALKAIIRSGDGSALRRAIENAPSLATARYLWRVLETSDTDPRADGAESDATLATTLFAIPVIIVAAAEASPPVAVSGDASLPVDGAGEASSTDVPHSRVVPGVVRDRERLVSVLREHRVFGACETFGLAGTLATAETIGLARLPALLAAPKPDVAGTELELEGGGERVFLRFLVGALLSAPGVDLLHGAGTDVWGTSFARALQAELATPGVSLLALPLPASRLVTALRCGRVAQREVAAQLFASNALRKFRARVGEPTAIVSAHHAADALGGGELRLSLSSPFLPREAEGLRVALYPYEAAGEVAAMLFELLADCRVADVRVAPGVHPDFDPESGLRRFLKNEGARRGDEGARRGDEGARIRPGPAH